MFRACGAQPGGLCDDSMDIFPTTLAAAGIPLSKALGHKYEIDGKDMTPVLRGGNISQHDVFLHYCGFEILAARVDGRWKVFWAMQNWYTNDPKNGSVCLECCNGINPLSALTGVAATQLCGCRVGPNSNDVRMLAHPVVYDMAADPLELRAIHSASAWPHGSGTTFEAVVARAALVRDRMRAAVHPTPSVTGGGTCTTGLPDPRLQPCCPQCVPPLLPMGRCHASGIDRTDCNCSRGTL
jgi:hypothetical protein